jgi:glycosyltransferase involved in cell wall biosynthesis
MRPRISVVIPTHDRKASLLRLLGALGGGGVPPESFEAWVVADGCSDGTVAAVLAEEFAFPVRVLEQSPARGSAAARNLGAAKARGELLVFLDDDIEPFPGMLAEHERAHRELAAPAAVVGPSHPVRRPGADWLSLGLWAWWEERFAEMGRPGHRFRYDDVFSGNLSIPADFFAEAGGFDDEILCGHDYDLGFKVLRASGRVEFARGAAGWHHEFRDHAGSWRRKFEEGRGDMDLVRRHPVLWAALPISTPMPGARSFSGILRRLAFSSPRLGDAIAGCLRPVLDLQEYFRRRRAWRRTRARLTHYAYWRGVASAVGSRTALEEIRRIGRGAAVTGAREVEIDLREGLVAAEGRLDAERPDGARLRFGDLRVGDIPPQPGAEPLRGVHLRPALATRLADPMIAALDASAAAGDDRAWNARASSAGSDGLPGVSVIIPAHDSADTLGETLDSLLVQTHPAWEAIVVDDGSSDDTAEVARAFASRDARISLVRQEHHGVGAARNAGIASARHDWLLFLDSDDALVPRALEQLAAAVVGVDEPLDAVHGGWARLTESGDILTPECRRQAGDLFELFAGVSAFPIHTCLVRKASAERAGRFDTTLRTCTDWDFWQRVARAGARFGRVDDTVALYRMRRGSPATDANRLLEDGLVVIERGHGTDPRVPRALHREGCSREDVSGKRLRYASWVAGLKIGREEDPRAVLEAVAADHDPGLNPEEVAALIFQAVPLPKARGPSAWDGLWPEVSAMVLAFLEGLEETSGAPGLAHRARLVVEGLTLDVSRIPRPFTRGLTRAVRLEIEKEVRPTPAPEGVEQFHCVLEAGGETVGTVVLPVKGGVIRPEAVADAITGEHAWRLLFRYFQRHDYPTLGFVRSPAGIAVTRAGRTVVEPLSDETVVDPARLHDLVGWTTFLQDLWGRPHWPEGRFYDAEAEDPDGTEDVDAGDRIAVEVARRLPRIRTRCPEVTVEIHVGGAPLGTVSIIPVDGAVGPQRLRAAIMAATGFELARVAVRETLFGRPLSDPGTLRERLTAAAERFE